MMNDRNLFDALLREDFLAFLEKSLITIHSDAIFLPNWHIQAIAYQLDRVRRGEITRLIINQPPRSLKSITVSVAYVAWLLGRNPNKRVICVSYSGEFAAVLHAQFKMIVNSPWYRRIFPGTVWIKETNSEFTTTKGGGRVATSVGGTITGRGGDMIIIDDPLNANEAQSEVARNKVITFFGSTLFTRLNDKNRNPIIVVAQRLHEDDLSGHLERQGGWELLKLPAIATEQRLIAIGPARFYRRPAGEVLHAARESQETLEKIKANIGSLPFSAQYQQAPVPLEGNLIRRSWFRYYEVPPPRSSGHLVQSWDIATMTGERNDYSVCTTWQICGKEVSLVDVFRGRLEYPALRRMIIGMAEKYQPSHILIEDAGAGSNLIQDLRSACPPGMPYPIGLKPDGDKRDRLVGAGARIEAGQVFFPKEAPWLADYESELLGFPNTRHDDQVDSTSQFLNWWWTHPDTHFVVVEPIIVTVPRTYFGDHPGW